MSDFTVQVRNIKAFEKAITAQAVKVEQASRIIVSKAGALIEREARMEFRPRPIGSEKRSAKGVYYKTNGPYAPQPPKPTSRSGLLKSSITTDVTRIGPGNYMSRTGPTLKYGKSVDQGTKDYAKLVETGGGKRRAFPYLSTGFEKARPMLPIIYREEWARALR